MPATVAQTKNLALLTSVNGFGYYRYDSLDANSLVDIDGYFNNNDDGLNIAVGDIIDVVVWATAIRSGTISTYGRHIVLAIAAGVVDLSDETVGVVVNS